METLTELVAKITTDAAGLKSGLSDAEKQTEASSKKMKDSIQKVGMAMAAAGAVITAAFGFMVKSAMETQSIRIAFENLASGAGQSSDELLKSLKAASKGAISEYDLMLSANKAMVLGVATNSEQFASLMEVARDRARAMGLTTTQAFNDIVTGIGRGSRMILDNLGIIVSLETANEEYAKSLGKTVEALTEDEKKQALLNAVLEQGQASLDKTSQNTMTASEMFEALKASIKDLSDGIGSNLLPVFNDVVVRIKNIVSNIVGWVKEHPELAKQLTLIAGALGIFLGVVGTALILIPKIKAAWISMQLVFTASPWGAIIAGIGLLIAAGILLWQNWDKVSAFFANVWATMKAAVLTGVEAMLGYLEKFLGWVPGIGDKIKSARNAIANMIAKDKVANDIKETQKNLEELTKTVTAEFDKQADEIQASYDKQRAESKKAYDDAVEAINKEYGIGEAAKEVSETKIDAAKRATSELKELYKREEDAAKDRYNSEMQQVKDLYSERLRVLNAETDAQVKALQQEIDAIDQQTAREELAITRAEESKRLEELKTAYESAETAEDKAKAKNEYEEYAADVARNELLRTRNEEKDALRDQIEEARERAESRKEQIQSEEDAALASLKTKYDAEIANYAALSVAADTDLANELVRIEADRLAALDSEKQKLDATLSRLDESEKADIQFYADQLARTNTQIADINTAYNALTKHYDIEIVTHHIDEYSSSGESSSSSGGSSSGGYAGGFASGGIVPGPVGAPILATVHGGETIIPANESMGNVVVNFTQPVFFDREDTMNRFVDMISKGIDRKYRLGGRSLA
jgi:hypothetical protein